MCMKKFQVELPTRRRHGSAWFYRRSLNWYLSELRGTHWRYNRFHGQRKEFGKVCNKNIETFLTSWGKNSQSKLTYWDLGFQVLGPKFRVQYARSQVLVPLGHVKNAESQIPGLKLCTPTYYVQSLFTIIVTLHVFTRQTFTTSK